MKLVLPAVSLIDPILHTNLERRRAKRLPTSKKLGRYAWSLLLFLYDQENRQTTWPTKILYRKGQKKLGRALARSARQLEAKALVARMTYHKDKRTRLLRLQKEGEEVAAACLPPRHP